MNVKLTTYKQVLARLLIPTFACRQNAGLPRRRLILDYAAKRTKKERKCRKGYNCGNSCINKALNCRRAFSNQASNYADWLKLQGEKVTPLKKKTKKSIEKVPPEPDTLRPLTDAEREQPEKLIEVGKSFAGRFGNFLDLKQQIDNYAAEKSAHYAREVKRITKVYQQRGKLQQEVTKLDRLAYEAKQKGDLKQSKELSQKADKTALKLKSLTEDKSLASPKPFDTLDELEKERMAVKLDGSISAEERSSKLAKYNAEIAVEKAKIPGGKQMTDLKEALSNNSPIDSTEAAAIFDSQGEINLNPLNRKRIDTTVVQKDFADVIQLTGDPPLRLEIQKTDDRAHATNRQGFLSSDPDSPDYTKTGYIGTAINIGNNYDNQNTPSAKKVTFHEYGHGVEFRHPEIAIANKKWIQSRSTQKKLEKLSKLTSNANYKDSELAYPDAFIHPYVGKDYSDNTSEVFSMGIQYFTDFQKMQELFLADPEHFYLTVGSTIEIHNKNRK